MTAQVDYRNYFRVTTGTATHSSQPSCRSAFHSCSRTTLSEYILRNRSSHVGVRPLRSRSSARRSLTMFMCTNLLFDYKSGRGKWVRCVRPLLATVYLSVLFPRRGFIFLGER